MAELRLVSVNIERSKHLDTVTSFLTACNPDVVCMQELCERDVKYFEDALQMKCVYAPAGKHSNDGDLVLVGDGIFTRLPISNSALDYYSGSETEARTLPVNIRLINRALASTDVEKEGIIFRIGTLHFTWTSKGSVTDEQRHDLESLLKIVETKGEMVFCGDFNAPRIYEGKPGEIFSAIAAKYKDNIPAQYQTSLDPKYHRAPINEQADKMVDGIFSTPGDTVSDVELHNGISDHCAITATITRS